MRPLLSPNITAVAKIQVKPRHTGKTDGRHFCLCSGSKLKQAAVRRRGAGKRCRGKSGLRDSLELHWQAAQEIAAIFRRDFAPLERALRREKKLGHGAVVMTPERMVIELQLTTIPLIRPIEKSTGLPLPGLIAAVKILRRHRLLDLNVPTAGERWGRWLDSYNARCAEIVKDRGDVTPSRYLLKSAEKARQLNRAVE
jgi:hypothetical protein